MPYRSFGAWLMVAGLAVLLSACATLGEDVTQTARVVDVEDSVEAGPDSGHAHDEGPAARASVVEVIPLQQATPEPEAADGATAPVTPAASMSPAAAPRPARPSPPPASPFEFNVGEAEKDASHPFFGVGHGRGFVVNGEQGLELVVVRGKTYTFNVDTGVQHDFYLSRDETGWGAAAWTAGVSGQFIYKGRVTFTPDADTPDLLYYQCRNHRNMGAAIHVVDAADEARVRAGIAARRAEVTPAVAVEAETPAAAISEAEVLQKIEFASMFINNSAAADRIRESGIQAALDLQRAARQNYLDARDAVGRGDLDIALLLVDESMRIMSEASRHVPRDIEGEAQRAQFEMFYEGARTFRESYTRNVERMRARDRSRIRQVDLGRIDQSLERARGLADRGQFADAIALLTEAQNTLTRALTEMLADESISYELDFKTPRDEYEYELARYESFERLIPIAIEQRQPTEQAQALMMRSVDRAKEIRGLVDAEVARGNYPEAILMLQGATSHIQRALQVVGVR